MINCRSGTLSQPLRHGLNSTGFVKLTSCPSYELALEEAEENDYPLVFFDAVPPESSEMSATDFVEAFLEKQKQVILIGVAGVPTSSNIFQVIKAGARGYLIPPFTPEVIEEVLVRVSEGPKIDQKIVDDPNPNQVFAKTILDHLDNLAAYLKKIQMSLEGEDEQPDYESVIAVDRYSTILSESVRTAKRFCVGSVEDLLNSIMQDSLQRAADKTGLRRVREKQTARRGKKR